MEIYTGYFGKAELYSDNGFVICSVARFDPLWFTGISFKELAPSAELLNSYKAGLPFGRFAKQYLDNLEAVDLTEFFKAVEALCDEHAGVVLCCHENPTQFCHRHLLAHFLNSKHGQTIREY